ncbi:Cilia- and flagella-associated protein 43 [Rhizophlyctis rosea]|nr:Cilia- and flagella-associated protein 43 [Rhizophlyctis rosea]
MQAVLLTREFVVVGGKDGILRWVAFDSMSVTKTLPVDPTTSISLLGPSPDWTHLIVQTEDGRLFSHKFGTDAITLHTDTSLQNTTSLDIFRTTNILVTATHSGQLNFWNTEAHSPIFSASVPGNLTCLATSPFSSLLAVGSESGVVRMYEARCGGEGEEKSVRLIFREKTHVGKVSKLAFEPTGRYLASVAADDSRVYLYDIFPEYGIVGYLPISGPVVGCAWKLDEHEEDHAALYLYVATLDESQRCTFVRRYAIPLEEKVARADDTHLIAEDRLTTVTYRIEDTITDLTVVPSHLSPGRESFYAFSTDRKLKFYTGPPPPKVRPEDKAAGLTDAIVISTPMFEYHDHDLPNSLLRLTPSREWLLTSSPDGCITIRTLMEPDKPERVFFAHDPFRGGVVDVASTRDCKVVVTCGGDGVLRFWEWRYTPAGRRAVVEVVNIVEGLLEAQRGVIEGVDGGLRGAKTIEADTPDTPDEKRIDTGATSDAARDTAAEMEDNTARASFLSRISTLRDRLTKAMQKNDTLPDLERIDKEEFVIDFEQRDALLAEADARVHAVRKEIEKENAGKRVVRNRMKAEFWDSMEVVGQSVKSFHVDPVTTRVVEVANYPIRKRTQREVENVERIRLLRRSQMIVGAATKQTPKKNGYREAETDEDESTATDENKPTELTAQDIATMGNKALLFDPFELTTNERKRTQIALLGEVLLDIKKEFNVKFLEILQHKQDEMGRIEEKNERITTILNELQMQEAIFHPDLDEDEVPQRVIEVKDSEVTVEKFITPEEQRRLEEKARQDEERARLAAEDNYRERAVQSMMGGKLDDRSETEDKEELIRPDWMNKPKEDMSEEERKLVKEFEKKLAVQKEEQEKYRKALETELRKLQSSIGEICDAFDTKLKEFFNHKLTTDRTVQQMELTIIKLCQATLYGEEDEAKEAAIHARLEELRSEKMSCMAEIPEIKKELEKCKEEYELALKRDKEIDRIFRKEFHSFDFYFDALLKLFKRREGPTDPDPTVPPPPTSPLNPYFHSHTTPTTDETPSPLVYATDAPEGLGPDLWAKLIDLRDRKIAAEQDVKTSLARFNETQAMVQAVLEESERIRIETDRMTADLNAFMEYRFLGTWDLEGIFVLKQGQVEVPQAPVVTDYTDAVLIHRGVVERLNENIVALGGAKVDALREMKDYRKGIHALEWENKMLDFQAEDLIIRTRDIQLLRVTKQMQEYIRGGDEHKQAAEVTALEKRAEYSQRAHQHKLMEKQRTVTKLGHKLAEKSRENLRLDSRLEELDTAVLERKSIQDVQAKRHNPQSRSASPVGALKEIQTRKRLVDLAKSQAQDIAILREEVERLRLRTYPAFPARRPEF